MRLIILITGLIITTGSCSDVAPTAKNLGTTDKNPASDGKDDAKDGTTEASAMDFGVAMGFIPFKVFDYVSSGPDTIKLDVTKDSEILSNDTNSWKSLNGDIATFTDGYLDAGRVGKLEIAKDVNNTKKKVSIQIHPVKSKLYIGSNLINTQSGINFGSMRVGDNSTQILQIENSGPTPFEISTIKVVGQDESHFKIDGKPPRLIENTRGTFNVTFTPGSSGSKIAIVIIEALIDDKPGSPKSILLMTLRVSGFAQYKTSQIDSNLIGNQFLAKNGTLYAEYNNGWSFPVYHSYGSVGSQHEATIARPIMIHLPDGLMLSPSISPDRSYPTQATTRYTDTHCTVYRLVSCYGYNSPPSCYGNTSPDLAESIYIDSIIDTDFGFLVTTYGRKPTEYFCGYT